MHFALAEVCIIVGRQRDDKQCRRAMKDIFAREPASESIWRRADGSRCDKSTTAVDGVNLMLRQCSCAPIPRFSPARRESPPAILSYVVEHRSSGSSAVIARNGRTQGQSQSHGSVQGKPHGDD